MEKENGFPVMSLNAEALAKFAIDNELRLINSKLEIVLTSANHQAIRLESIFIRVDKTLKSIKKCQRKKAPLAKKPKSLLHRLKKYFFSKITSPKPSDASE